MAEQACALELYNLQKDPEEKHNLLEVIFTSTNHDANLYVLHTGATRCQATAGGGAENAAHASLSRNGRRNLPAGGFCHKGCAKWFPVHWMV